MQANTDYQALDIDHRPPPSPSTEKLPSPIPGRVNSAVTLAGGLALAGYAIKLAAEKKHDCNFIWSTAAAGVLLIKFGIYMYQEKQYKAFNRIVDRLSVQHRMTTLDQSARHLSTTDLKPLQDANAALQEEADKVPGLQQQLAEKEAQLAGLRASMAQPQQPVSASVSPQEVERFTQQLEAQQASLEGVTSKLRAKERELADLQETNGRLQQQATASGAAASKQNSATQQSFDQATRQLKEKEAEIARMKQAHEKELADQVKVIKHAQGQALTELRKELVDGHQKSLQQQYETNKREHEAIVARVNEQANLALKAKNEQHEKTLREKDQVHATAMQQLEMRLRNEKTTAIAEKDRALEQAQREKAGLLSHVEEATSALVDPDHPVPVVRGDHPLSSLMLNIRLVNGERTARAGAAAAGGDDSRHSSHLSTPRRPANSNPPSMPGTPGVFSPSSNPPSAFASPQ